MGKLFTASVLRFVLAGVSTWLVSKGMSMETTDQIIGLLSGVLTGGGALAWSWMDKESALTAKQAVAATVYETSTDIEPEQPVLLPAQSYLDKGLLLAMGASKANCNKYEQLLIDATNEFGINTPLRIVHFLAQVYQESGRLQYTREIWDGKGQQAKYDTRTDLGNTSAIDGDGKHNRGVGLIQTTGETNIEDALAALGYAPDDNDRLAEPDGAARSAAYFWYTHGLNQIADTSGASVKRCTRVVNGGYTHLAERQAFFDAGMSYMASKYL